MKKKEKHICMSCLGEFDDKEVYWVYRTTYSVLHCENCLKENNVEKYIPYLKPRKPRTKKVKE